jgi:xanthosine utilization system XapX-like protein
VYGFGRGAAVIGTRPWWTLLSPSRIAAFLSVAFGGEATLLGGFFASGLGVAFVATGMLAGLCMLIWLGARALEGLGRTPPSQENGKVFSLAIPTTELSIDTPKNRSLDYLAFANEGEFKWDKSQGEAAPAEFPDAKTREEGEVKPADSPPKVVPPDLEALLAKAQKPGVLDKDAFSKGLSRSAFWANGGGQGDRLRDGLAGFNKTQTFSSLGLTKNVKPLSNRLLSNRGVRSLSTRNARSNRAMGQLKFAKRLSNRAGTTYDDSKARQYATDAFEQGRTIGSDGAVPIGDKGMTTPLGDGAPGVSEDSDDNSSATNAADTGTNATPYQPNVDRAKSDSGNAAALKALGALLIALGVILALIGMKLMSNPFTAPIGVMILMIGIVLIAAGIACLMMGQKKANDAKGQGKQISDQYGQKDQGDIVDECSSEAIENGTAPDYCTSEQSDSAGQQAGSNNVHKATEAERKATYKE